MFGFGRRRKPAEQAQPAQEAQLETQIAAAATWQSSDGVEIWQEHLPGAFGAGGVMPQSAMRHAAVYRCVSILAFSIAMLPLAVHREVTHEDGEDDRAPEPRNTIGELLRFRPNPRMSRTMFWRQMVAQMLLRGNGVAWIERLGSGDPIALWPVPRERASIQLLNGRLVYDLLLDDGRMIRVDQDDVLHIPGSSEWDGLWAKSPIQAMGSAVGIGIEADRFARKYFENDATPPGYIGYPTGTGSTKVAEQKDEIRRVWKDRFGGENRHSGPAVLTDGGEYKVIKISALDAQLLESRRFQIEDIARIFGVPRFLLAMDETSWGSGIEALGIGFVTYSLDPHLEAIEDELDHKLFGRGRRAPGPKPERLFAEFEREGLLRGNVEARNRALQISLGGNNGPGWQTPNEVRRKANLPRSNEPGADKLTAFVPGKGKPSTAPGNGKDDA
jgi:HK97 family phage portal protein